MDISSSTCKEKEVHGTLKAFSSMFLMFYNYIDTSLIGLLSTLPAELQINAEVCVLHFKVEGSYSFY